MIDNLSFLTQVIMTCVSIFTYVLTWVPMCNARLGVCLYIGDDPLVTCWWEGSCCYFSCYIDTLSLPYTHGTDLDEQVMGWIKLSLLLSHRPLWVAILCVGGHQTWQCCWINLLVLHTCVALLEAWAIGYSEPRVNTVGNYHALCCAACNFLQVATQVGYTSGESAKGCECVQWCQECRWAAWSLLKSELWRGNSAKLSLV